MRAIAFLMVLLCANAAAQLRTIPADAKPGQRPRELGEFVAVPDEPGCWIDEDDYQFCALVFKEENT